MRSAGIIAAGEGSRLKLANVEAHKPMVHIAGWPLIGHVLGHFAGAGIQRAVIIFNESGQECADWVRKTFPSLELEILIKTTQSSFESFWRVGRGLGPGRHLISTVDSVCSPADFRRMIAAKAESPREVFLGVTSFVHDEKPLWIATERETLNVVAVGGDAGLYATAGLYNVSGAIFEKEWREDVRSLRVFLKQLLAEGIPMRAIPLAEVIDVDTAEDINLAESFLSRLRNSL